MKKTVALTLSLLMGTSIAFSASAAPVENSSKWWVYDAVKLLIKDGIVTSYDDTSLRSGKTLSRGELAKIVNNAMENEKKANIAQRALIEKLAGEFALEMNNIVDNTPKVEKEEKKSAAKQPNIEFSGELSTQYKVDQSRDVKNGVDESERTGQLRIRLDAKAKIDENTTFQVRLANRAPTTTDFTSSSHIKSGKEGDSSIKATQYFATTKIGAFTTSLGRQAMDIDPEGFLVDGDVFSFDGASVSWDWEGLGFNVKRGAFAKEVTDVYWWNNKWTDTDVALGGKGDFSNVDITSVMVDGKTGKLKWDAGFADFTNPDKHLTLMKHYFGNLDYAFTKKFALETEFGKNQENGGKFYIARAVFGDRKLKEKGMQSLELQYANVERDTIYNPYSALDCPSEGKANKNTAAKSFSAIGHPFYSWDLTYKYAFSPNKIGKIEVARITDKDNSSYSYSFWKLGLTYKF